MIKRVLEGPTYTYEHTYANCKDSILTLIAPSFSSQVPTMCIAHAAATTANSGHKPASEQQQRKVISKLHTKIKQQCGGAQYLPLY
jgi:hypothetical protein